MQSRRIWLAWVCCLGLIVLAGAAWAQSSPELINYQGRLTDDLGQPLGDGTSVDLRIVFYGVESGQAPVYLTVLQEDVLIQGDVYNVLIGSGTITPGTESTLADVFQKHKDVWMGIEVNGDGEMSPRFRIASVPYAMKAGDGVPKGLISMWSGSIDSIPVGWQLCDGSNGTPDLRNRFIMGTPDGQDPGQTGGESQKTLALANMPSHNHSITIDGVGDHSHRYYDWFYPNINADFWIGGLAPTSLTYDQAPDEKQYDSSDNGAHIHTATIGSKGNGSTFDNRPAYYTLAFIMKR